VTGDGTVAGGSFTIKLNAAAPSVAVAAMLDAGFEDDQSFPALVTSAVEVMAGKHDWEVELLDDDDDDDACSVLVGVTRPNLDPTRH
jgi:hypothetical protein